MIEAVRTLIRLNPNPECQGRAVLPLLILALAVGQFARAEDKSSQPEENQLHPLASKQEMIRDRFQRFQDRVFRLRQQISEKEPENAARLGRALSRAGELELAAKLDELIKELKDTAALQQAVDAQAKWLEDADKLLSILLEQDSQNKERRDEIEKLKEYQKKIGEILAQQQGLRGESADAVEAKRLAARLDAAIKRVDQMLKQQSALSQATKSPDSAQGEKQGDPQAGAQPNAGQSEQQKQLSDDAAKLAEDLKQMSQPTSSEQKESPAVESAKSMAQSASQSMQGGSQSMSQAGQKLAENSKPEASKSQQEAEEALQDAREQLENAKQALQEKQANSPPSSPQRGLAQQTKSLSGQMQQDSQSSQSESGKSGKSGKAGKSGSQSKSQSSKEKLDQAEDNMEDAAESLDEPSPEKAIPKQDNAIENLQEAQRELEEQLQKLRKEERDETLRDLEARFRDMLAKQRPINDATLSLDQTGRANFKRAEELQLADLATAQRGLADKAQACLHILDEEGTTVAFPRVVNQLAEDMTSVAERLAGLDTGTITQAVEQEIIDTLTQLLDAVKKMQQENEEQAKAGSSGQGGSGNQPLLPPSAELKLLKASQVRINTRTTAIDKGLAEGNEAPEKAVKAFKTLASRQSECSEIARQMREKAKD